jgi:hypothetical protein
MAKKAKECFIYLDFALEINVQKEQVEKFFSDIERGEFSLSVDVEYGDGISSGINVYPDMFKSGSMTLSHVKGDMFSLACKGVVVRKLQIPFEQDLLASLEQSDLLAIPRSLTNSDAVGVDLDEQDKKLHGRCSLT